MMAVECSLTDVAAYDHLRNDEETYAILGQLHEQYDEGKATLCTCRVEGLEFYAYWPAH